VSTSTSTARRPWAPLAATTGAKVVD
jgi:hypothetical protein